MKRRSQPFNWIAFGDEFVTDIEIIIGLCNRLYHSRIVDLLFIVEVIAARVSSRMEMSDLLNVFFDGSDEIALHNLHVVDVVEQLYTR